MNGPMIIERARLILTFLTVCSCLFLTTTAQAVAPYWEDFTPQASVALQPPGADDVDAGRVWIAGPPPTLTSLDGEFNFAGQPEMGGLLDGIKGQEIGFGGMVNRKVPGVSSDATEPIPEPSTFWLLGTGLLLLGGRLRKKIS